MERGLVLNIQRYCIHDGPGIRTTVFLKGCPLNCSWCHNPESQPTEQEVSVIESRCARCGECVEACPQQGPEAKTSEGVQCTRCGACVAACPTGARQMLGQNMTVEEVSNEFLRDRVFYDDSGGGVTFSGGEPLMQPSFLTALLEACRRESIHTTVDTCGFAPWEVFLATAPLVDLFLYDLKIVDDQNHQRHTGVSNALILDNLKALGEVHENIWIRIPLIPGFNDDDDQLKAAASFVAAIPSVRQVHLLPYHELGSHKAVQGDGPEKTPGLASLSCKNLDNAAKAFRDAGLSTLLGG